ncbi:MAG: flavodoxin family protein [Gammaproteobacteria bacterium]|nr:flavodoxin family protein [Gammaproteobacteria bacterium]
MKIVAINSSPKGPKSNTCIMVEAFLDGVKKAGADAEQIFLSKHEIKPCLGCFSCWFVTPGKCVIKDDMSQLLDKIEGADVIVFATPLYFDNISGMMKNFMDRTVSRADPRLRQDENGESVHASLSNKKSADIVVMSNCGFPEQSQFQVLHLLFQRVARNCQSKVLAEIYRSQGPLLSVDSPLLRPLIAKYKKLLQHAGEEIVRDGKLSSKTEEKLSRPIVPCAQYIKTANQRIEAKLAELKQNRE